MLLAIVLTAIVAAMWVGAFFVGRYILATTPDGPTVEHVGRTVRVHHRTHDAVWIERPHYCRLVARMPREAVEDFAHAIHARRLDP
jgi:hypothetical protein